MNWQNLKSNKCPKCGEPLVHNTYIPSFNCKNVISCKFTIGENKFVQIVNDLYKPKPKRCGFESNFETLQNLGREETNQEEE